MLRVLCLLEVGLFARADMADRDGHAGRCAGLTEAALLVQAFRLHLTHPTEETAMSTDPVIPIEDYPDDRPTDGTDDPTETEASHDDA